MASLIQFAYVKFCCTKFFSIWHGYDEYDLMQLIKSAIKSNSMILEVMRFNIWYSIHTYVVHMMYNCHLSCILGILKHIRECMIKIIYYQIMYIFTKCDIFKIKAHTALDMNMTESKSSLLSISKWIAQIFTKCICTKAKKTK